MKREQLTMGITLFSMGCVFGGALLMIHNHIGIGMGAAIFGGTFGLLFLAADAVIMFPYFPTSSLLLGRRRLYWWCMWNIPTAANIVAIFNDTVAGDRAAAQDAERHYYQYNVMALEEAISKQNRAIEDWFTERK